MSHRELLRQWAVPDDFDPALNEPEVRFQAAHVRQQHPELSSGEAHERALARIIYQAWAKHRKEPISVYQAVDDKIGVLRKRIVKYAAVTVGVILLWLILLTVFSIKAHAQIDCIKIEDNTGAIVANVCAPFVFKAGANCAPSRLNNVVTFNCAGGSGLADPGSNGIITRTALNTTSIATSTDVITLWGAGCSAATWLRGDGSCTAPAGGGTVTNSVNLTDLKPVVGDGGTTGVKTVASLGAGVGGTGAANTGAAGKVLIGDGTKFVEGDPLVQGLYAAGTTVLPNPVILGGQDYSGTPTLRTWKVDSSGNGYAVITFASPQHVIVDSGAVNATLQTATGVDIGNVGLKGSQTLATVTNLTQLAGVAPTYGDVNNAAAIAGALNFSPVGRYNATTPTLTDTRYNMLQLDVRGGLHVVPGTSGFAISFTAPQHVILDSGSIGNTSFAATGAATPGDGVANPTTAVITQSFLEAWNGATWDRVQLEGSNADTDPVDTTGSMATHSHNMMFNGTNWDRLRGDTTSGVWVNVKTAPANQSANIAQVAGGAVTATNVAITDAPLNTGAQAVTADNAAVTATRKVQLVADTTGKQIVMPYSNPENFLSGATSDITSTTATSIIAGVASNHLYITSFCVMNSHASVDTWVNLTEETSGTVLYTVFALHGGGGACQTLPVPIRLPTAAKALQATCVTTGANVRASAAGYKAVQ